MILFTDVALKDGLAVSDSDIASGKAEVKLGSSYSLGKGSYSLQPSEAGVNVIANVAGKVETAIVASDATELQDLKLILTKDELVREFDVAVDQSEVDTKIKSATSGTVKGGATGAAGTFTASTGIIALSTPPTSAGVITLTLTDVTVGEGVATDCNSPIMGEAVPVGSNLHADTQLAVPAGNSKISILSYVSHEPGVKPNGISCTFDGVKPALA